MPRDMVGRLDEQADNARPDGAQTDDADTDWCALGGNDSKKTEQDEPLIVMSLACGWKHGVWFSAAVRL